MRRDLLSGFALWLMLIGLAHAGQETSWTREEYNFRSSLDNTGPLVATAIFDARMRAAPLMVVQHGYKGTRADVEYSAKRFVARGYFSICIDTRGRGTSAGQHDDGGLEVMDVYDGIRAATASVDYSIGERTATFSFSPLTSKKEATGRLVFGPAQPGAWDVRIKGVLQRSFTADEKLEIEIPVKGLVEWRAR